MISIIGGGPIGLYTAYLLKKANPNLDVNIFEKKSEIGKPVQCTGILTNAINEISEIINIKELEKNNIVVNKIKTARLISPNNEFVDINLKQPDIIVDREKFDKYFYKLAKSVNVKINLNYEFKNIEDEKLSKSKIIIGADGPNSKVAQTINKQKTNKQKNKRNFLVGVQARIKFNSNKNQINKNIFEVYFGNYICPGFFAWFVPENNQIARVGLATKTNPNKYFENFLEKIKTEKGDFEILEKQGGLIPVYDKKLKISKHSARYDMFLIGDAATQVKTTTGGGVVQGLIGAKQLSNAIITNKYSDYEKNLKKAKLTQNLNLHAKARKILNKFKDKDYNRLIKYLKKPSIRSLLATHSRDNFASFGFKLFIKEPKLLYFITKFLF